MYMNTISSSANNYSRPSNSCSSGLKYSNKPATGSTANLVKKLTPIW